MTVIRRIVVSFAAVAILMVAAGLFSQGTLVYVSGQLKTQRDREVKLATLIEQVKAGFYQEIDTARAIALQRAAGAEISLDTTAVSSQVKAAQTQLKTLLPDEVSKSKYQVFETAVGPFENNHQQVVMLASAGQIKQASALASGDLATSGATVQAALDQLGVAINNYNAAARKHADNLATTMLIVSVCLGCLAVLICIGIVISLVRITKRRLSDVITKLGTSTAEMLAVASQVSAGAVQTATSVSEAATTVEEVRQTSLIASQKARAVADSAEEAEQVAEEGVAVVSEAIEGLKRISAQMAVAADCVVRLSEQTEAISEIISTSNDIAEQSNLLSVNAAIEAAKATDAGKGFTVVAEEIKSLAQQSKQGVMQVRGILNDIQKATSAAVMAAEQSCKMVEAHSANAVHSHKTIESLGESVAASSQLAMQIAASAQQQLAGMDQISEVMTSINTASTQNAAGSKQMEAEVNHLHELAEEVRSMLGKTTAERAAAEAARSTATEYIRQAMVGGLDEDDHEAEAQATA
jgi:methyl-accepting chemotaxis protein